MNAIAPTSVTPVIARPPDLLGGATIAVGGNPGDLQAAVDGALHADGTHRQNTYLCPPGATYLPLVLPDAVGSGWTCIRTAGSLPTRRVTPADRAACFRILSNGQVNDARILTMSPTTAGWRFVGLEGANPNDNFTYAMVEVLGARISFERCILQARPGQPMRRALFVSGATDFQIHDSWLAECKEIGSDAQAIFFRACTRALVSNCEAQATSENILVDDQGSARPSVDVTIRGCHLFKPLTWRQVLPTGAPNPTWDGKDWSIKNLFEIKWVTRLLLEDTILENNWADSQNGTALLLNDGGAPRVGSSDILLRDCTVINAPAFCTLSTFGPADPPKRVAVWNNTGLRIGARGFLLNHAGEDYWLAHNTLVPMDNSEAPNENAPRVAIFFGPDGLAGRFPRLTIKDTVMGGSQYGLFIDGRGADPAAFDQFMPDREFAGNAVVGLTGQPPLGGVTYYPTAAAAKIDLVTGALLPGSPLLGAASDGGNVGADALAMPPPPIPEPVLVTPPVLQLLSAVHPPPQGGVPMPWTVNVRAGSLDTQGNLIRQPDAIAHRLYRDGVKIQDLAQPPGGPTEFSLTVPEPEITLRLGASALDAAGNESTIAGLDVPLDAAAPIPPTFRLVSATWVA